MPFQGTHVIVTGGGRGLGAVIARELATGGANLTLMGRDGDVLEVQASELKSDLGATVNWVLCDVTDEKSVTHAFMTAEKQMGVAQILVNNAGQAEAAKFGNTSSELWRQTLEVNLTGAFFCIRCVIPGMIRAGWGRIVNIASSAGLKGYSHVTAYCAAKHGLVGLTRALAVETAKTGITVNAVCPGYIAGAMTDRSIESLAEASGRTLAEARAMLLRNIPRGALIRPEEVAATVAWLCTADASAITGQAISITAGEIA